MTGIVITAAALAEALGLLDAQIGAQHDADIAVATAQNGVRLLQTVLEARPAEEASEVDLAAPDTAPDPAADDSPPRRAASEVPTGISKRTPERDALFRELWPDTAIRTRAILDRINALPGEPYTMNGMWSLARKLGLPTRRTEIDAAPDTAPASTTPPAGRLPGGPAIEGATEEDLLDAQEMIRKNPDGWPGRKLADWFGWPIEQAGTFAQWVRAEMATGRRAAAE